MTGAFALVWPDGRWRLTTPHGHREGQCHFGGGDLALAHVKAMHDEVTGEDSTLMCWPMTGEVPQA